MKHIRIIISIIILLFTGATTLAQNAGGARISKISFIFANGHKNAETFLYDEKNRIKQVDYLLPNGGRLLSFTDFKFDNNNKPVAYKINYLREGGTGDVTIRYDNRGRVLELLRKVDGVTYSYTYNYTTDGGYTEVQKQTSEVTLSNNKFTHYTEDGDYRETYCDIPNKAVLVVLKPMPGRKPSVHTAELLGGFETPIFLGIQGVSNDNEVPRITDTKDENGLTVLRTITVKGKPILTNIAYEYAAKPIKIDTKKDSIKIPPHITPPPQGNNTVDPGSVKPPTTAPAEVTASKETTIKGKLFYRYKRENEKPVSKDFDLKTGFQQTGVKNGSPVIGQTIYYPAVLAEQRFPKSESYDTKPLKNARFSIRYKTVATKAMVPKKYEDMIFADYGPDQTTKFSEYYLRSAESPVVATGETDANGNFTVTFLNDYKLGLIGQFEEKHNRFNGADVGGHALNQITESYGFFYMHGVFRIVIEEYQFFSPEIIMQPKPGETLKIPDEVALVNAMDLTVKIVTDTSLDQAVGTGAPLSNYPVKIARLNNKFYNLTGPFEAAQQDMNGALEANAAGQQLALLDDQRTDGNGEFTFKNLVFRYDHTIKVPENTYDGSFVYLSRELNVNRPLTQTQRDSLFYNSQFTVQKKNALVVLKPKLPELYVRTIAKVQTQTVGLQGANVQLKSRYGLISTFADYTTLKDGYLQIKDLPVSFGTIKDNTGTHLRVKGPTRSLTITKDGYKPMTISGEILQLGQRWPKPTEVIMTGMASVNGTIKNESGEGVASDIRIGKGPWVKTQKVLNNNGFYFIDNCEAGTKVRMIVVPSVDQYFSDTSYVTINAGPTTKIPTIVLKEKLHRVVFKITDANFKGVANAEVRFNNNTQTVTTNASGLTSVIAIASPGKEFNIRVKADGFVDYDDYVVVPISKEATTITIPLTKGITISGTITDSKTNKPIAKARVYTITGYNDDGEIQQETYTDANGHYDLKGIAKKGYFFNKGSNTLSASGVTVYAVKTGSPGYIQNSRIVKSSEFEKADLPLEAFDCKSEIWGLPVEITEVQRRSGTIKISGAFVKLPANATFRTARAEARLPFKDVEIKAAKEKDLLGGNGKTYGGSGCSIEPLKSSIETETDALKMIAFDKFNCEVTGKKNGHVFENLEITKSKDGCGVLSGLVATKLESFNFSYNYTGSFIIQPLYTSFNVVQNSVKKNEMIEVSGDCAAVKNKYRLAAEEGRNDFYVNNFLSHFISAGSYVVKDTFSLAVSADVNIPLLKTTNIDVGDIKIMQNSIKWEQLKKNISLPLESWVIKGKGLVYDKNLGGFSITDPSLQTNLPEIPLKQIVIKPTTLDMGEASFEKNISLAGVSELVMSGAKIGLVLDASAPHDHKPHWRANLVNSSNGPAAYLSDIPGLAKGSKINILMFTNYSDGKKTLELEKTEYDFFSVLKQKVSDIEIGSNYYTLIGLTNLGIPGCNTNITGRFKYMIDAKTGKPFCTPEKLNTDAELAGKVFFSGKQSLADYTVREGFFSANGTAIMYEKTREDGVPLSATLIKTTEKTYLKLDKNQVMPTSNTAQKMLIDTGLAVVSKERNKWGNLKFTGRLVGFDAVKGNQNLIDFEVKGAIANDPSSEKKIGLQNLETPFGAMSISFDFQNKIFNGSVSITENSGGIPIPPYLKLNKGIAEIQIDSKGLVITGAFPDVTFYPLAAISPFKAGLAIGYYQAPLPPQMQQHLREVTTQNAIPDQLNQSLTGIYFSVSKSYGDTLSFPGLPQPVASVNFGADIRTFIDLKGGIFGDVFAKATASCSATVLGCESYVTIGGMVRGTVAVSGDGLTILAEARVDGKAKLCPIPEVKAGMGVKLGMDKGDLIFTPSF